MDRFESYIDSILNGMYISKARRDELTDEMRDHLQMLKNESIISGCSEEQAEIAAIQKFGETEYIKKNFQIVFTPFRRLIEISREKHAAKSVLQWTLTIIFALIISISIRSYAFAQTEVKQVSMQNTLYEGQHLIENKIDYYFSSPKRGDIIIINRVADKGILDTFISNAKGVIDNISKKDDSDQSRLIKRLIGIPGDIIDIRDGKVYINDVYLDEPYVKGMTYPNGMKFPIKLHENEYFAMGDNRERSMDCRAIGPINVNQIEGKAIFRLWPLDKFGEL